RHTRFSRDWSSDVCSSDLWIAPVFDGMNVSAVAMLERAFWWLHICGILIFLNYLYYSKHLHILLAFPNTYFADLRPKGQFDNLRSEERRVGKECRSRSST